MWPSPAHALRSYAVPPMEAHSKFDLHWSDLLQTVCNTACHSEQMAAGRRPFFIKI